MLLTTQMLNETQSRKDHLHIQAHEHNRHFAADGPGVIESMKRRYRKQLLSKLFFEGDDDEKEAALGLGDVQVLASRCIATLTSRYFDTSRCFGCGNCEEDDVSSWLYCDADDAGFQLMNDGEIIAEVRKPNSDDDNSETDEDEVIETSKISNSDAFECFAKGLMRLEQQIDSDSTELMLLK
ncbi:hypothetical protein AVEN_191550-1 [Araneus ventricosus]|uniref:Uncharacterized protein n=1 Tax=Araneus ventricosus TaxID=182803 RepID=A0A4Y2KZM5_ARAVE|nr:hypothetical protein AVEN_191550-1 [Araneus ventricosus]